MVGMVRIPIGAVVVPFCGLKLGSYKVIPKSGTTMEPQEGTSGLHLFLASATAKLLVSRKIKSICSSAAMQCHAGGAQEFRALYIPKNYYPINRKRRKPLTVRKMIT